MSPSGERSNGISSAWTTLRSGVVEAAELGGLRDARRRGKLQLSRRHERRRVHRGLSSAILGRSLTDPWAAASPRVLRRMVRRIGHDLLEQQMHEQEERLRLHHQQDRLVVGIVVEMLMDAAILDDHHVAGLPLDAPPVMHVMAVALEDLEHGAVHMAVLLAEGAGAIGLDMRLDRLRDHRACGLMTCLP